MKVECDWNGKQHFVANINGFKVHMDASKPFGDEKAPTPKQLVLAALCGCTGMDVIGLLKKSKQMPSKFTIQAEASNASIHPQEMQNIKLKYLIDGNCSADKVNEAVELSQTKYCSVSSMISRGTTISYDISLNGKIINHGQSDFTTSRSTLNEPAGLYS